MVKYAEVLKNNTSFLGAVATPITTAVFVGATNGIGLGALRSFAKHTSGAPTIYIVGRSTSGLEKLISELKSLNASAKYIPIQANDLTLIKDAAKAADQIAASAQKIDLLVMSPGYVSAVRDESPEGLDRVQAIRYYSRMRFLVTLAPLLRASPAPRIVNVLGAGKEGQLWPEDWRLKENFSLPNAAGAASTMTVLFFEKFASMPENQKISIAYTYPGLVAGTGFQLTGLNWILKQIVDRFVLGVIFKLFGYSAEEAGERQIFAGTSANLGRQSGGLGEMQLEKGSDGTVGSGVYLLDHDSSTLQANKVLKEYQNNEMREKVWAHTMEEFELAK